MKKSYIPHPSKREYVTFLFLFIEIILFGVLNSNFFSYSNITQVIQNASETAMIAIGMDIVIIVGGIDLSVGKILGVIAVIVGYMLMANMPPVLIVLAAVGTGLVLGFINGIVVTRLKLPDFVATLATLNILSGAIFALLNGNWLTGLPNVFAPIMTANVGVVPAVLILVVAVYAVCYLVMNHSQFGRSLYLVGSNQKSAEMVGINIRKIKMISYSLIGCITGIAAILYVARMGSVEMTVGSTTALDCIAAVVIGGTGFTSRDEKGTLFGTLAGVFFIAFLHNGIILIGIPSLLENFFVGVLLILTLLADILSSKRQAKKTSARKKVAV